RPSVICFLMRWTMASETRARAWRPTLSGMRRFWRMPPDRSIRKVGPLRRPAAACHTTPPFRPAAMSQFASTLHASAAGPPAASPASAPDAGVRSLALLAALAGAAAGFRLLPLGIEPRAHTALAIGLFMICCWMTQVLDHGLAGILGCFLFWMLGV